MAKAGEDDRFSLASVPSIWARAAGFLLDQTIIDVAFVALLAGVWFATRGWNGPGWVMLIAVPLLLLPLSIAYYAHFTARSGQTPGKWIAGTRVVDMASRLPTARQAIRRSLLRHLLMGLRLVPVLALVDGLPMLRTWDRRSLHDTWAGTRVLVVSARSRSAIAGILLLALASHLFVIRSLEDATPLLPRSFYVPSRAMEPSLQEKDRIITSPIAGGYTTIDRGDIVMFEPPSYAGPADKLFAMRVVAVGGDTVAVRDGSLWVNGQAVNEPWVTEPMDYTWPRGDDVQDAGARVPAGHLFVLGDNRNGSHDSHRWGERDVEGVWRYRPFLPEEDVAGKAVAVYWPPDRIQLLR